MSPKDTLFTLVAIAVGLAVTVGLWLLSFLIAGFNLFG